MRVCFVTTSFPRWEGDHRAPFLLELAKELKAQGCYVRVITTHIPGTKNFEVLDGIEVFRFHYLPERWEILQKEDGGIPAAWRKYPFAILALIALLFAQVVAIIRYAHDCDLIHANWTLSAIAAWLGKVFHRKPYILTVHGSDVFHSNRIPLLPFITKLALNSAKQVIAVSSSLYHGVVQLGVRKDRIIVISNGINLDRFFPGEEQREETILFVGNITETKGIRYLLEAFPSVLECFPSYRLVLVGDGPQKQEFQNLANTLNISRNVLWTGSQPQGAVASWMRRSKLFILPSLSEGFGVVLVEAMASGLPCIGTSVGGIPEIIVDDGIGVLVPPADPKALSKVINKLLADNQTLVKMGKRAAKYASERYAWPSIVESLLAVYQRALLQ